MYKKSNFFLFIMYVVQRLSINCYIACISIMYNTAQYINTVASAGLMLYKFDFNFDFLLQYANF